MGSLCHGHDNIMKRKRAKKRVEVKPVLMALSPVFEFALTHLKMYYRTSYVTFGFYSLTTFSSCLLLFCDLFYLSHVLNHKQNLFVFFPPSLFTSLLPVNILLPNLSQLLYFLCPTCFLSTLFQYSNLRRIIV